MPSWDGWEGKVERARRSCWGATAAVLPADEFNRVIIPVKRGEENTDYVNASFIDVSGAVSPELSTIHGDSVGPCSAWENCL